MRRLKIDVDLDSDYVVIELPVRDFKEIAVAASLHCYDSLAPLKKKLDYGDSNLPRLNHIPLTPEGYHDGLLHFIKGIEALIDMQVRPYCYEDPIPLISRSAKERRAEVEQERYERQLLDKIIEEALAAKRAERTS